MMASDSGSGLPTMDFAYLRYPTSDTIQRHLLPYPNAPRPSPTPQSHVYYDPYSTGVTLSDTYTYGDVISKEGTADSHSTTSTSLMTPSASPDNAPQSHSRSRSGPLSRILKSQAGPQTVSHGRVLKSQTGGKVALRSHHRSRKRSSRNADGDDEHLGPCWRCRKYKKPVR